MYGDLWISDLLEPKGFNPIVRQRHDPKDLEKSTFLNSGSLWSSKLQQVAEFKFVAPCLEKILTSFFPSVATRTFQHKPVGTKWRQRDRNRVRI
jgi:hypothetical protein